MALSIGPETVSYTHLDVYKRQEYILPCHEHNWGQRCVCFYDPDRHIIEVGEPMDHVAARFLKQGMRPEQVAERTMFPLEIVLKIQKAIGE